DLSLLPLHDALPICALAGWAAIAASAASPAISKLRLNPIMTFLRRYFLDKRFSQIAGSVKCSNAAPGPRPPSAVAGCCSTLRFDVNASRVLGSRASPAVARPAGG